VVRRRFERPAAGAGDLRDEVQAEIHFQPFELNPKRPGTGRTSPNTSAKSTVRPGAVTEKPRAIRACGAELGFAFRTDGNSRIYNTFDAHRLLHWAGLKGAVAVEEALFKAYFTRWR
jgi:predicted DsbA family dithiol-disulfide isomerase